MKPEVYYHWTESAVARSSYDYLSFGKTGPKGPFEVFIRTNFQNSLWFSELVWPDFDMFQSHQPHSIADALARAMSGGPIYCTDTAGMQNWGVLSRVQLSDGTVLRPDAPGRPTLDCLFQADEARPYKVFSRCGETALLAVWNLSNRDSVAGTVRPADVHGLKGKTFAVYEHFSGRLDVMKRDEPLSVRLGKYGARLFLIRPVQSEFEPLGLLDKFVSPAAVVWESREKNEIQIELMEGGVFGAYAEKEPKRVILQDKILSGGEFFYQNHLLKLRIAGRRNVRIKMLF